MILILAYENGKAQGIQPVGLPIGRYEIPAKSSSQERVFCVNRDLSTSGGQVYNLVQAGVGSVVLTIGGKQHGFQEALDRKLISLRLAEPSFIGERDEMNLEIINHTDETLRIDVVDDFILADKSGTTPLKSLEFLNPKSSELPVDRQNLIWFSHEFNKYLGEHKDLLIANELLKPNEQISLVDFLKRRENFLKWNGESLKDTEFGRNGFTSSGETSLKYLLYRKDYIRRWNSGDYDKCYQIKYQDGNYIVDDGSPLPIYSGSDVHALAGKLDVSGPTYVQLHNFPSEIRENNFLSSIKIAKRSPLYGDDFLLYKTPMLTNITNVFRAEGKSSFHLTAQSKRASTYEEAKLPPKMDENKLTISGQNNSFIAGMRSKILEFFGGSTGKRASHSLASILEESKQALSSEFSANDLKIILNDQTEITLKPGDLKNLFKIFQYNYCYDSSSNNKTN